jgi:hypothetical protein
MRIQIVMGSDRTFIVRTSRRASQSKRARAAAKLAPKTV